MFNGVAGRENICYNLEHKDRYRRKISNKKTETKQTDLKWRGTMKYEWLDEYCLAKKGAEKDHKLEWNATRYMIRGKMFAMQGGDKHGKPIITVKLEPLFGELLRKQYI